MIVKNDFVIVCPFGMRTLSYINKGLPHLHAGLDIRAPYGAEIIAPELLKVKRVGVGKFGEGFVVAEGLESDEELKFIHVKAKIKTGDTINKGVVVAISDGSGTRNEKGEPAPHLHFETWLGESWAGGKPVDPDATGYCDKYLRV